jgi:hypothetical protein
VWGRNSWTTKIRVKASVSGEDGGRRYKEQLDKIHCVMVRPQSTS